MQAQTGKGSKKGFCSVPTNIVLLSAFNHTDTSYALYRRLLWKLDNSRLLPGDMETSKNRSVSNTVMFSTIFLSLLCFAGLIHVEIKFHVHRQMLQVLNQQREEKLELRKTANDENESEMKMLHSDSNKGELECFYLNRETISNSQCVIVKAIKQSKTMELSPNSI